MRKPIHDYMEFTDLKDMLNKTGEIYGDRPAYVFKTEEKGKFREITHKEFRDDINSLGTALIELGLKGKRVAVISDNRYEWGLVYLAVATGVGVIVPLDKALPDNEIESLMMRSEIEAIVYSKKYDEVMNRFEIMTDWLANLYVNTLNVIQYMHDKYSYESLQMALHDRDVFRTMACGIAGLSVAADSLSAIKHAKVKTIRNEAGIAVDFEIEGDYPKYGNNDDRVDDIAIYLVESMMNKIRKNKTYRNSVHTQSVLTITSNVVYGKKTGNTPCGRRAGAPFAPGANPMHGRDNSGALASLSSVAKLPYEHSQDGISNTFSIVPGALGKDMNERVRNLSCMMDGYFTDGAHHLNVNVFDRATLEDAMEHPEKYPQLTIRVSGYAVNFIKLTKEQQLDVINRTFHGKMA